LLGFDLSRGGDVQRTIQSVIDKIYFRFFMLRSGEVRSQCYFGKRRQDKSGLEGSAHKSEKRKGKGIHVMNETNWN
jgi:hypothetical protein